MCESKYIKYTCGCKKEMGFIQCEERLGTNVRCHPVTKSLFFTKSFGKSSGNYCSRHLVKPDAEVKYTDQMGANRGRIIHGMCA